MCKGVLSVGGYVCMGVLSVGGYVCKGGVLCVYSSCCVFALDIVA